jgi:prepilin-type N-terminal cleavage/methylation domain-containing protein
MRSTGKKHNRKSGGFTLIEVVVAVALVGFTMSLVFFSWNYILHHTITQQQKSLFQAEAGRLAQSIASELGKSPEVTSIQTDKIIFLSSNATDTSDYEFVNGALLKNNKPVPIVSPGAYINLFSIEKEKNESRSENLFSMITMTIGMHDNFNDSSVISLKIRIAYPESSKGGSSEQNWNF